MKIFFLLCLLSLNAFAQNLSQSFPAGKGSSFKITMKGDKANPVFLSLYVAGTRVDSVHIEYFMETKGLIPLQMWQQFEIGISSKGAEIRKGYVQTKELTAPESMPPEYLKGASGGIQVNDFLFADKAQLDKDKVGVENVEIAAGTTKSTHYRVSGNGQTVDYWISDDAKPMGLVMLVSKSDKDENQNYSLELTSLMDNVKAKILPEKAVPLTDIGKSLLAKPESMR
jgi:hypothetical protein